MPAPSAAPPDLPSSSPKKEGPVPQVPPPEKTPPKRTVFGYAAPTDPSKPTKDNQLPELPSSEPELPADTQPEIQADTQPELLPDAQPQEDTAPALQDLLPPPQPVPQTGPPLDTVQPAIEPKGPLPPTRGQEDTVFESPVHLDTQQLDAIQVDPGQVGAFDPVASVEESLDQTLTGPQFPGLDPIPVQGPLGFFGGLPYFFKVTKARFQRSIAIRTLKREINQEQRQLDEILRDLGKKARDVELDHPPLQQEMEHLRSLEDRRSESEAGNVELTEQQNQADQTFENVAKDCNQRLQAAQEEITTSQAQLNEKSGQLRALKSQLAQQQRQLQSLSSSLRSKTTQAAKAAQPDKQEALQQEAVELSAKMEQLEQQNTAAEAEIAQLQGPVDELTGALTDARQRLQQARQELAAAQQELNRTKGNIKLHGQINQAQDGIGKREQQTIDLEHQRESYDRAGMKNGMIIAGSIAGLVLILVVILIILVS
jgi:predicted  nucleic acid-binding Zn-ribbon protein